MRQGLLKGIAVAILSLLGIAVTTGAAFAITDYHNMICRPDGTNSINGAASFTNGPFGSIANGTALLHLQGGGVIILITNGISGSMLRQDTGATIITPPVDNTETILGPGDVAVEVPFGGIIGGAGGVSVTMTCIAGGGPVGPPPVAGDAGTFIDGALADHDASERSRINSLIGSMFDHLGTSCNRKVPLTREEYLERAAAYESNLENYLKDIGQPQHFSGEAEAIEEMGRGLDCEYDLLVGSPFRNRTDATLGIQGDPGLSHPPRVGPPSAATPPLPGTGQPFIFLAPGGNVTGMIGVNSVNRSVPGIERQSADAEMSFLYTTKAGENATLGVGVKIGTASSTQNVPVATLNSTIGGIDLLLARRFGEVDVAGYFGVEGASNRVVFNGITDDFLSSTLKAGGAAEADFQVGDFLVSPRGLFLFQARHREAVDLAGIITPPSNTFVVDLDLTSRISRTFVMPEQDMTMTSFIGGGISFNSSTTTPALGAGAIRPDVFTVHVFGGVEAQWNNGMTGSLQLDFTRGATTTGVGASASLRAPIETLFSEDPMADPNMGLPNPMDSFFIGR